MKSRFKIILTLAFMIFAVACQNGNRQSSDNAMAGNAYRGIIPCADCAGIDFIVSLQNNGRYKVSSMYIGKSDREYIDTGRWKIKQDTLLILQYKNENNRTFDIANNKLIMLKADQTPVTGPLAENYVLYKVDSTRIKKRNENTKNGSIDFKATGNEPFWALTIDFEQGMTFSDLGGDTINVSAPEMRKKEQSEARILKANNDSLAVIISPVGCIDDMSGQVFNYQVILETNDNQYSGCGEFVNPKSRINEIWVLYSLNGNKISQEKENKIHTPFLQFSIANQRVNGNTGCNLLNGSFSIKDSSISFSKMATTKKACPDQNSLEQSFLKALTKVNNFDISNGSLIMRQKTDTVMVFYKTK